MVDVIGTTKARNCCTFLWMQDARAPRRIVFARPYHCAACVGEMVRSAKLQRITILGSMPMDRIRGVLARQRPELIDRWQRQLLAASEAGFGLDGATAEVLPQLLDAADRALERRFRAVPAGTPAVEADSRRSAMQSSLLGDFLFDAVLETCPEINAAEQRLLSDALAHASVEVLVKSALERGDEKRRREQVRLAKLAHELRNSVTAASLALDLLGRKEGALDSKAGRALQQSLAQLRAGLEDRLLDDILTAGGLRLRRLRLAPMLADARTQLGAQPVKVMLEKPPKAVRVEADARLMKPAVRGLLEAAISVAQPGSTIRCAALEAGDRARVAVTVDARRKLRGNRLPDLPSLEFVRRAARAHGGSLSTKVSAADGCVFRLDLPCLQPH